MNCSDWELAQSEKFFYFRGVNEAREIISFICQAKEIKSVLLSSYLYTIMNIKQKYYLSCSYVARELGDNLPTHPPNYTSKELQRSKHSILIS